MRVQPPGCVIPDARSAGGNPSCCSLDLDNERQPPCNPVFLREAGVSGKTYWVYLLASRRNGTLYIGVTNDLARRVHEHKSGAVPGFTRRYGVHMLVWYENYSEIDEAIAREKSLKRWERAWKIRLIEGFNPQWQDLYFTLNG
jgi:putative endonuclease